MWVCDRHVCERVQQSKKNKKKEENACESSVQLHLKDCVEIIEQWLGREIHTFL